MDGGTGLAEVGMTSQELDLVDRLAVRTSSDRAANPTTGAELGAGADGSLNGSTPGSTAPL